jgi:hypothetical protein
MIYAKREKKTNQKKVMDSGQSDIRHNGHGIRGFETSMPLHYASVMQPDMNQNRSITNIHSIYSIFLPYVLFNFHFLIFLFLCSPICIKTKTKTIWSSFLLDMWKITGHIGLTRLSKDYVMIIGFATHLMIIGLWAYGASICQLCNSI